jgi:hypothetical protein
MTIVRDRHTRSHTNIDWLDISHVLQTWIVPETEGIAPGNEQEFAPGQRCWLHVARRLVRRSGDEPREGGGAKIEGERRIELDTDHRSGIRLFDRK